MRPNAVHRCVLLSFVQTEIQWTQNKTKYKQNTIWKRTFRQDMLNLNLLLL